VEELLATLAHELRRPLAALLGALATIQQRGPTLSAGQHQELLAMALRQGSQLQRLLEQLLVAAALDQSQIGTVRPSLVDAAALATEAGRAAQLAHPDHRITIQAAGPLLVIADPLAISRILGNLLVDPAAHSPAGSPILVVSRRAGSEAVLAVGDQGPGIPPAARERIFDRYARLKRPAGPAVVGLGLGLDIARRLARANGGELWCTDPPGGRGACFELRLPMTRSAPGPNPRSPAGTHREGRERSDRSPWPGSPSSHVER
jgi:two-component system, OmpR family, sensor kinase